MCIPLHSLVESALFSERKKESIIIVTNRSFKSTASMCIAVLIYILNDALRLWVVRYRNVGGASDNGIETVAVKEVGMSWFD